MWPTSPKWCLTPLFVPESTLPLWPFSIPKPKNSVRLLSAATQSVSAKPALLAWSPWAPTAWPRTSHAPNVRSLTTRRAQHWSRLVLQMSRSERAPANRASMARLNYAMNLQTPVPNMLWSCRQATTAQQSATTRQARVLHGCRGHFTHPHHLV